MGRMMMEVVAEVAVAAAAVCSEPREGECAR